MTLRILLLSAVLLVTLSIKSSSSSSSTAPLVLLPEGENQEITRAVTSNKQISELIEAIRTEDSLEKRTSLCTALSQAISSTLSAPTDSYLPLFTKKLEEFVEDLALVNGELNQIKSPTIVNTHNRLYRDILTTFEKDFFLQYDWARAVDSVVVDNVWKKKILKPKCYTDPDEIAGSWVRQLIDLKDALTLFSQGIEQSIRTTSLATSSTHHFISGNEIAKEGDLLKRKILCLKNMFSFLHESALRKAIGQEYKDAYDSIKKLHTLLTENAPHNSTIKKRKVESPQESQGV